MFAFSVLEKPDCPAQKEGAQSDCSQGERADSLIIYFAGCCTSTQLYSCTSTEHFIVVSEQIIATFPCVSNIFIIQWSYEAQRQGEWGHQFSFRGNCNISLRKHQTSHKPFHSHHLDHHGHCEQCSNTLIMCNMEEHDMSDFAQVDKRSLIIFPAVSILFNAGYWVHFLLAKWPQLSNIWTAVKWPDRAQIMRFCNKYLDENMRRVSVHNWALAGGPRWDTV